MSTSVTSNVPRLPDLVGWKLRRPTVEECELVGREASYAAGGMPVFLDDGDTVIETAADRQGQTALAVAFEQFGMCDAAHVIPAGVYLEE